MFSRPYPIAGQSFVVLRLDQLDEDGYLPGPLHFSTGSISGNSLLGQGKDIALQVVLDYSDCRVLMTDTSELEARIATTEFIQK